MKLVCIDTCTKALSIAAMEDGVLLGQRWQNAQVNHSILLMPMLSELLETLNWDAKDVDYWAAVSGPGSFTGVRIGVSSVRALAHGWNKRVISVSTLEALANSLVACDALIVPLIDARRDQVYAACYDAKGGALEEVIAPVADSLGTFLEQLSKFSATRQLVFVGDGAIAHSAQLLALENARIAPEFLALPQAGAAAQLAWQKLQKEETLAYNELEPVYLRKSQAERALEGKA